MDITQIERSLHRFIPLIRFYVIEPADFIYKVYCYKDILHQDLVHNLLEFHIVHPPAKSIRTATKHDRLIALSRQAVIRI